MVGDDEIPDYPRKRRDRLQIMAEVLKVTNNTVLKTQIMYKASLSFAQLNEYLTYLLERRLLRTVKKGEKRFYKTTRKGAKYLKTYAELRSFEDKPNSPEKPEEHLFSQ